MDFLLFAAAEATGWGVGIGGISAASLLGGLLYWLLNKHLPAKDAQIEKLVGQKDQQLEKMIADKDESIRNMLEAHAKEMKATRDLFREEMKTSRDLFREESFKERESCERRHKETIQDHERILQAVSGMNRVVTDFAHTSVVQKALRDERQKQGGV